MVQDKQGHSLNQHDNDTYDGIEGTDMANGTDKLRKLRMIYCYQVNAMVQILQWKKI